MKILRSYRDPLAPGVAVRVRDEWISNGTYGEMVQKTPIPCTDVILTTRDDAAIYLGRRVVFPMAGIWCLGGRIFFNDETFEDSVSRCLYLETGVRIIPARFENIGPAHLYSWAKTAQGEFGGKNLAIIFKLEVSPEEIKKMSQGLNPKEYDQKFGLQRFGRDRLMDEAVHPAMIDLFDDIFGKA
jgi:ADP-ribose pyrophosphatase YjhB (NUDIX family)